MAGNNRIKTLRDKNPRNPESELFKKLTKLFSGPVVNYRRQQYRRELRVQLDKYKFKSASGKHFKKSQYNPFESLNTGYMTNQGRVERYADFDQMEYMPEIASAIDIYADEMTTSSHLQPLLKIDCPNDEIKDVLYSLYHNILNIEFNLFGWCRSMCKYGDFFLYIDIDEKYGIKNVIGLPVNEVERLEGEDKTNPNYVQFQWNSGGLTFENWQMAHFRILGNDKYAPYGTSILEPARRIYRQLILIEDAMMAYRIVRSPERRVFYIDIGNIPPEEVEQYMQKIMTQMKRNQVVDPSTGRVDLRYNPLSIEEDYFLPVRGGISSKIETLPGGTYTGDIDDVKYLRDKLFSALKVPQSYLSQGEGAEEDKTTLAQKDVRFARTIQRLQRSILSELEKIGMIHLYTLGFRGEDIISFKLHLNNPSKIAELQELEHWRTKFDVANAASEGYFSRRWVAKKLFNLSEDEIVKNQREMFFDKKFDSALQVASEISTTEEGAGGAAPAGPAGGLLDMLGGPPPPGGEEAAPVEGEAPTELAPEGEEGAEGEGGEGGDDSVLLAAPGKRDEGWAPGRSPYPTTTPASKHKKYYPKRDEHDLRRNGGRNRHNSSLGGRSPRRDTLGDFARLANVSLQESKTNYSIEENKFFEINQEVRDLISNLELKKDEAKKDEA